MTGWWFQHPSEKYEFVNWDDEIPHIWENKKWQPVTTNQMKHAAIRAEVANKKNTF